VTFKSQTFLLTIILLLISSVVGRALACSAQKPESFIELKDAQFVVVGKMLADPDAQDKFFYRGEILVETVLAGDKKYVGSSLQFQFLKSTNRALRGVYAGTKVIAGLTSECSRGIEDITFCSVFGPCDSMGVIIATDKNVAKAKETIVGEALR
jgi:hypothetical protein